MKTMLQWGLLLTVALPLFANSSWESLRRAALERRRMVIYNTDGCDAGVYFPRNLAATPENFLSRRLIHVRGSQVDSVFYCPISSGFGNFTCRLKTADWFIKDAPMYPKFRNISRDLNRLGTDPLRLAGEFCRREKLEFFVSIRVNDTHDAAGTLENPHHLLPKFKQEHPEFLMGTPDRRPPYCSWSAVDFSHPEVRARMRNFVREFAVGYDIDGIEYDFMRHMQLFRSVAWGGVASSRELATMTEFLRELRAITEEEGRKRGRPILVAIRVPDSPEYCRAVGIDLEAWLKNRVTDLLIAGGYFHLEPWSNMVALARRYGVKFYASLDESRIRTSLLAAPERNSAAGYHARALEALESGADGLYYFNLEGADAMRRLLWGEQGKTTRRRQGILRPGSRQRRVSARLLSAWRRSFFETARPGTGFSAAAVSWSTVHLSSVHRRRPVAAGSTKTRSLRVAAVRSFRPRRDTVSNGGQRASLHRRGRWRQLGAPPPARGDTERKKTHSNRRRTAGRQLRLENGTDFIRKGSAAPFRTR